MSPNSVWISSASGPASPPDEVADVLAALADLPRLPLRDDAGGIARARVADTVCDRVRPFGLSALPGCHADAISERLRLAVRCEAGRAHTNNDGLVAVLEAATDPMIDVLLLVAPHEYKGSVTAAHVTRRVRWLLRSDGLSLALQGVAVISY